MRCVALEEYRRPLQDAQVAFVVTEWVVDSNEVNAQFLLELFYGLVGGFAIDDSECLVRH